MKKQSKATVKTPIKDLKKGETVEHYNSVLLEDIKSKMELVLEGMDVVKSELKKEMHNLDEKLTGEIELLKTVVHKHSVDIEWETRTYRTITNSIKENNLQIVANSKKMEELDADLKVEMHCIEKNLSEKIDKIGERLDDHENRIVNIEKNLPTHP